MIKKSTKIHVAGVIVAINPSYSRPIKVNLVIGDASKSRTQLGWAPKYDLSQLVDDMMEYDLRLMMKEKFLKDAGHDVLSQHE